MKEALTLLGDIVHQLQKERGYIALFLGSRERVFSREMTQQFQTTDQTLAIVSEAYQRWEDHQQIKAIDKLNYRLKKIAQLPARRVKVSATHYSPHRAIHFYTYDIIAPLIEVMVEVALFDQYSNPGNVSAYSNFLQWKERIGRERAIGALGFSNRVLDDQEFIERLKSLVTEQESYQKTFFSLANKKQIECLNKTLNDFRLSSAYAAIESVHQALDSTIKNKQIHNIAAETWYTLMSCKIDSMFQVEKRLIDTLTLGNGSAADNLEVTNTGENDTSSVSDCVSSSVISQHYIDFLKTLPFFSNLENTIFNQLIQSAHLRKYKKGKILFLEREQPTRFYIILQGWIKLYKGTVAGEETILQMLSSGDSIVESAVFLNAPYPLSAQIAETATLLSFPAPMVRQLIRNNTELAVNMLTNLSQRSQLLIQQVETTRLKTANERVGWFLLKTLMEQGESKNNVKLPYDKAMIASYLDMKPETFSRTLKRFKSQGFYIENDTIILPSASALCGYCDINIASTCSRNNTKDCPDPQCPRA